MSNYTGYGTATGNGSTASVSCRGWATLSAHITGTGTLTWEFLGADGVWRTVIAGSDNITEQVYTASNMINVFFGNDVAVRLTVTGASGLTANWQIMSNPSNRSD